MRVASWTGPGRRSSLLRAGRLLLIAALLLMLPGGAILRAETAEARFPATRDDDGKPWGVVVLMYHRFGEDTFPSTNIRLSQFEAHLAELRKPQYTVMALPKVLAALRDGRRLPARTVVITIDDAYRSIYSEAWQRLRQAGFPFTVFVSTEALDRGYRDLMTWTQLRQMVSGGGVTIGNHTVSHLHMTEATKAANRRELRLAGRRIAAELGQAPVLFAYPYGEYSLDVRHVVAEEGFEAAFGQHSGAIGPGMDRFALPRFAMNEHYGEMERFRLVVNALPLPVESVIPRDRVLTPAVDPPLFGFTLAEDIGDAAGVTCYVSGQGRLELKRIGPRRLEGRPAKPLGPGRSRINCTLPGPDERWRWYGVQFYRAGGANGS